MNRVDARTLVKRVLDPDSWKSWDTPPEDPAPPESAYAAELAAARARTGYDEAVITGEGTLHGRRVAVAACEFSFLAGSIGVAAAERLVRAIERATDEGLPLLASPASGGTRMQEGALAFAQMVKITAAVARHRTARLPYLVYLRHPTTGGVFASWGSLGHVTAAEPGALIGFLGPRVYRALYDEPFPEGVQVAENLHEKGLVDAVVEHEDLGGIAARVLDVLCAPRARAEPGRLDDDEPLDAAGYPDAWESIRRSRRPARPGVRDLLRLGARDVTPLTGTGEGEDDPGLLLALARFGTAPCVVLGQDRRGRPRRADGYGAPDPVSIGPAGLREARRGIQIARELRLPLLTVVDTRGAALSKEAEERGLAGEIARCITGLVTVPAPTVCLLLGEGAGGAALALLAGDRVLAAQHAWLSPLPPEGASVIVHRTTGRAAEMAAAQGVRSLDLRRSGIVDRIVPERPDAADEPAAFCARVSVFLEREFAALGSLSDDERMAARLDRYRNLGSAFSAEARSGR